MFFQRAACGTALQLQMMMNYEVRQSGAALFFAINPLCILTGHLSPSKTLAGKGFIVSGAVPLQLAGHLSATTTAHAT